MAALETLSWVMVILLITFYFFTPVIGEEQIRETHGGHSSVGRPTQNFGWVGHNAFGPTHNWPVMFVNSQEN